MIVVRGKQTLELDRGEIERAVAGHAGITIDVGAGDGAFAYRYARAHRDRFVIALDPVRENMREYSARAARKPERGGMANLMYAVGSIELAPAELRGIAGELYVMLPWGSLMRGLILGEAAVLAGLASLARPDAIVRIVLNTRIFDEPVPIDARDLPEPTPDYASQVLAPRYERAGLRISVAREFSADEVLALGTTWAKRLSHRRPPPSLYIEARVIARTSEGSRP